MPQSLNPSGLYMNLAEWAKFFEPDGSMGRIVRMLTQKNEIMQFLPWRESNMPVGERTIVETSLPTIYRRHINSGTGTGIGEVEQVDEGCSMFESWCDLDEELARINGQEAALRSAQFSSFAEKFSQSVAQALFYDNSMVSEDQILGLAPRYSSSTASNAQNILNAGGQAADNTSIWLIGVGDGLCSGLFPKGTKAGLEHTDWGKRIVQQVASTPDGGIGSKRMVAWSSQFKWHFGLNVADWTSVTRIANISTSQLQLNNGPAGLLELMMRALERPRSLSAGKFGFFMNRTTRQYLRLQARADVKLGGQLRYEVVDGKPISAFQEVPIMVCDQLLNTEAAVPNLPLINNI